MTDRIKKLAEKYSSVIMGAREYFHANPGIEFQEFETTKKIRIKCARSPDFAWAKQSLWYN